MKTYTLTRNFRIVVKNEELLNEYLEETAEKLWDAMCDYSTYEMYGKLDGIDPRLIEAMELVDFETEVTEE